MYFPSHQSSLFAVWNVGLPGHGTSALRSDSLESLVSCINSLLDVSILSQAINEGTFSKPNISDTPIQHVQAFPTTGISEACQT